MGAAPLIGGAASTPALIGASAVGAIEASGRAPEMNPITEGSMSKHFKVTSSSSSCSSTSCSFSSSTTGSTLARVLLSH